MLADALNRYVSREYDFDTRRQISESAEGYSKAKWNELTELGVIGALFTEAQGGFGGSGFDIAVVFESLGRGLVVEPLLESAVVSTIIVLDAPAKGHEALGRDLMSGVAIAAFAHGEPDSGYSQTYVTTSASRSDGGWVLNGCKVNIGQGQAAGTFIVSARVSGNKGDAAGLALFAVPASSQGLRLLRHHAIDGGQIVDVVLDNVHLPESALLGGDAFAAEAIERAIGRGVLALCAEAVGVMDVARDSTLEYLKTRKQFGVPIGSFQALQHRMATMLIEIEQARSAMVYASAAIDSPDRIAREKALSTAKFLIGRIGVLIAEECIQMHGGIGMTAELPLSHYAKRLVMIDHQYGDAAYHLQRFIALGKD